MEAGLFCICRRYPSKPAPQWGEASTSLSSICVKRTSCAALASSIAATIERAAFAQLTGLPETSRQVEDLCELDRLELALRSLEELGPRQSTLEASRDRARAAFRNLTRVVREIQFRVQALEAQSKQHLSATQRGTLYQLVQT